MAHVIYILIIAFLIVLLVKISMRSVSFQEKLAKVESDYDELDKGMTEVTDAYATDMAQYEETISNRDRSIEEAFKKNRHLEDKILELEAEKLETAMQITNLELAIELLGNELSPLDG